MDSAEMHAAARTCTLLASLTDAEVEELLATAEAVSFHDGQCIVRSGDEDTDLYIILEGAVRISQESSGGETKTLAVLGPGSFFGEMGLAAGLPRTADAFAEGQSTLSRIKQSAFFALMESGSLSGSKVMLDLFRVVGPRLRQTNTELVAVYAAGRLMSSETDVVTLLTGILDILRTATGARTGAVLLSNRATDTLDGAAALGYEEEDFTQWSEPPGAGIASQALDRWQSMVVKDWNADPRTRDLPVTGYERVGLLVVPLIAVDDAIGAIVLGDRVGPDGEFTPFRPADQVLVEGVAAMTASGIANARHLADLREREKLQRHYIGDQ